MRRCVKQLQRGTRKLIDIGSVMDSISVPFIFLAVRMILHTAYFHSGETVSDPRDVVRIELAAIMRG